MSSSMVLGAKGKKTGALPGNVLRGPGHLS